MTQTQAIIDDDEWQKQRDEYAAHVESLSKTLRPCACHGNAAAIEDGYEGELWIMAVECGCWSQAQYFDSIDECVAEWNNQPNIDRHEADLAALRQQLDEIDTERGELIFAEASKDILVEDLDRDCDRLRQRVTQLFEENKAAALRVQELEAQLAAASQWQPLPDGWHDAQDGMSLYVGDDMMTLHDSNTGYEAVWILPDNIRLSSRTPAAGE